jgi:uncharacterized protein
MWLADLFSTRKTNRFFELAKAQAALLVDAANAFKQFVTTGAKEDADRIDRLRAQGRELLDQVTAALRDAFVTPIDRQDIYNLGEALDDMLGYLNNATREINLFAVHPTHQMQAMAEVLATAAMQIKEAVELLQSDPARSWRCAKAAEATEGLVEDQYRHAVLTLFDGSDFHLILKQREIYRHLSNSADRAQAIGRLIGKIVVKAT